LAEGQDRSLAELAQALRQADRHGCFAFAGGCRRDCRDEDEFAGRFLVPRAVKCLKSHLRLVSTVRLEVIVEDS